MVALAGGSGLSGTGDASWVAKDIAEWGNPEVRAFLEASLPGHPCTESFRYTSGRVLSSLSKDDLRSHVRDEEAANVIWAELTRLRARQEELASIEARPCTVFVRTPAELVVELEVLPTDTIAKLKARIAETEGTPVELQRLTRNGGPLADGRTLASYNISSGTMLLLVPRLTVGSQRYALPATSMRALGAASAAAASAAHRCAPGGLAVLPAAGAASGLPRPRVPIMCADITRPFPMSLEFEGIPEYQSFMLALQRQAGRRDSSSSAAAPADATDRAPFLEILPMDNMHEPVQTRIFFDTDAEVLNIDTVGDVLMECTRYRVLLHLRDEQKSALLVTGIRLER